MTAVADVRQRSQLIGHMVGREFRIRHRRSLLGWAWAIIQPLIRLAIFTFVFTQVIPLGIESYSAFLFTGLIAWTWFASGLLSAAQSPIDRRFLFFQVGTPRYVAPVVSVLGDTVDFILSLPVLFVAVAIVTGSLHATVLALPIVMLAQFLLILGLGAALAAGNVYARDVSKVIEVAITLGFYITPVFYQPEQIPEEYRWLATYNPMAHLINAYRDLVIEGEFPNYGSFGVVFAVCAGTCVVGLAIYKAYSPKFVDEL